MGIFAVASPVIPDGTAAVFPGSAGVPTGVLFPFSFAGNDAGPPFAV